MGVFEEELTRTGDFQAALRATGGGSGIGTFLFQSLTVLPSATLNTFGAQVPFSIPSGYKYLIPLHIGLSTQSVVAETIKVRTQGQFSDGSTIGSATSNYTTVTGDIDPQNLLYALIGAANGNAGQLLFGKQLLNILCDCQSTINSSTASVIMRLWAMVY